MFSPAEGEEGLQGNFFLFTIDKRLRVVYTDYSAETDLYYLKTRYYDPEIGRFISIDGISYLNPNAINGLNLYAYCNNNPVMYVDYDGMRAILVTYYSLKLN